MELNRILCTLCMGSAIHMALVYKINEKNYINMEIRSVLGLFFLFINFYIVKYAVGIYIVTYMLKCLVEIFVSKHSDALAMLSNVALNLLAFLITFIIYYF